MDCLGIFMASLAPRSLREAVELNSHCYPRMTASAFHPGLAISVTQCQGRKPM